MRRCFSLDETIHGAIIFIAGVSLCRFLSCWVTTSGIFLTMNWASFAVVVFALGILLRERFHRWLGLGMLVVGFVYKKFQDAIRKWL
jgi:hypothetical protein